MADFLELVGSPYMFGGAKDGAAVAALFKANGIDEISKRWRIGLKAASTEWASCRTLAQLRQKWNDLATAKEAFVSIEHRPSRMM